MLLKCPNCAGNVSVTENGLRGDIMVCDYCRTPFHIKEINSTAYKQTILRGTPPRQVKVMRNGSTLAIQLLNGRTERAGLPKTVSFVHFVLTLLCCILIGVSTHLLYGDFISLGMIYAVIVPVLLITAWFFLPRSWPTIQLTEKKLHIPIALGIRGGWIGRAAIKQLFVTIHEVVAPEHNARTISLIALTKSGKRIPISSEFSTFVEAIYVEALLEKELGLFDLPVLGEVNVDVQTAVSHRSQPPIEMTCFSCGVPLIISANQQQSGFSTCEFCQTVTLLYIANSDKLILGQPDPSNAVYALNIQNKQANITLQDDQQLMLQLTNRQITLCQIAPSVEQASVEQFTIVKAQTKPSTAPGLFSNRIFPRYEQVISYSQKQNFDETDEKELLEAILSVSTYHLVGNIDHQKEILLPEIEDVREAAFLVERLNRFLATLR